MSAFTDTIERNWPNYVLTPASSEESEGWFSWNPCESCGTTFGGHRSPGHAIHREAFGPDAKRPNDVHAIAMCDDCVMYHANGVEPEEWRDGP